MTISIQSWFWQEWNPACYGKWIDHLVRQGYLIIFPRYQKDINPLSVGTYTDSAAYGIPKKHWILWPRIHMIITQPDLNRVVFVGHSFGGVETANLAHNYQLYNLPKPKGIFMACPGTNALVTGQLSTYQYMDSSIKILTIVEQNDAVVDSSFSLTIFNGTPLVPTSHKNFIRAFGDSTGTPTLNAAHGESYSPDTSYSDGQFGSLIDLNTIPMCLANNKTDATDEYVYWKLCDAFIDCAINGRGLRICLCGDTREQKIQRGVWSNGTPVRHMYVRPEAPDSTIGNVWPGDANADGLVNNIDLLNIGLAYSDTGTIRPSASNIWSAQPCPYWINSYVTDVNHNSGDCNGDGVVNAADTTAILLNYTAPRTFYPKPFVWPANPPLYLSFENNLVHTGDTAIVNFELGDSVFLASNIYGVVFSITYDSSLVVPNTFSSNYANSWLGHASELLSLKKELRPYDQIDIGVTRTDHTNRNGFGPIGQLRFTTVSSIDQWRYNCSTTYIPFRYLCSGQFWQLYPVVQFRWRCSYHSKKRYGCGWYKKFKCSSTYTLS